jgi:protein-glutamine gamma-glutamyltransferase
MTSRPSISKNTATPPFLLLAALLFWGWLSGLLLFGAIMGVVLESSRFIKVRFDLSAEDFRRLWNFCGLLGLALLLYTFTTNQEGGGVGNLFHGAAGRNAVLSGVHAASVIPRWFPILSFLLVAAQNFSERGCIPLAEVSIFFRWFQRGAAGAKANWDMNVSYPYFMVCVFSAGIHANDGTFTYLWGQGVLLAWGLWPFRARRFSLLAWGGAFLLAVILAYLSTRGIGQLAQLAENYNAQWMTRLMRQRTDASQAMTAIGQIGELKLSSTIVIRLETPNGASPPTYLHEATYRRYDLRQTWRAGGSQNDFQDVRPETNEGSTYDLLPDKTAKSTVNIACYLNGWDQEIHFPEGLLPLPTSCSQLENIPSSVVRIRINKTGAVLVAGPGLIIFDARYGAATTIDSPPDTNWDWEVPPNEWPALKQSIGEMKISGTSDEQKELAVAQFFSSKFTYSTWLGPDKTPHTNGTPLGRFLLQTRSGHCEYFATATVLLLRALDIPARYAVGYYVHEGSGDNHYVVRDRDAHAWCLVWNKRKQAWQDFDTTPGSWIAAEGKRASAMQSVSDFFSWLQFQFSKLRWGQTHLRNYVLWAVVPAMSFLLYQIVFRRGRKRRAHKADNKKTAAVLWPGLDSEFYQLESRLAARGVPRQPGEALSDWLERLLTQEALGDLRESVQELLQLHYRHRFDPNGLGADKRKLLAQKVRVLLQSLAEK